MELIRANVFGQIIEVDAGFLHSSDINPDKPINWKRMIDINGEYGCMGDLGLHVLHVPLRSGWQPQNVRALLSNIVRQRYNKAGELVPCETWDNAILSCEVESEQGSFPMTLKTYRIAPGETNTWYINIYGTAFSVRFSTRYPKSLYTMAYQAGGKQLWSEESLGYEAAYPSITGGIFEFGFPDSILQMWAAFCDELVNGREGMLQPLYCATPQETAQHHQVLTAALASQKQAAVIAVNR
jgi:predicted dehydrogenase